jgi:hypothetical protein
VLTTETQLDGSVEREGLDLLGETRAGGLSVQYVDVKGEVASSATSSSLSVGRPLYEF